MSAEVCSKHTFAASAVRYGAKVQVQGRASFPPPTRSGNWCAVELRPAHRLNAGGAQVPGRGQHYPLVPFSGLLCPPPHWFSVALGRSAHHP